MLGGLAIRAAVFAGEVRSSRRPILAVFTALNSAAQAALFFFVAFYELATRFPPPRAAMSVRYLRRAALFSQAILASAAIVSRIPSLLQRNTS
jgi:hypothetical protein